MTNDRDRYARLYYRFEAEFPDIFDDDRLFAWWCRLLLLADASWPMKPRIARSVPRRVIDVLRDHGLLILDGDRYEVRGMQKERLERSAHATKAARDRWAARGNAPSNAPSTQRAMPSSDASRAKQSKAEQSSLPRARDDADPAETYFALCAKFPSDKVLRWLDDLSSRHGSDAVSKALATEYIADPAVSTLLGRTNDRLRREARELDRAEREDEQRRLAEKRARPKAMEPWQQDLRDAIRRQYEEDAA